MDAPRTHARPPRRSFNLTPMMDVVFQLLLFFLLACRFLPEEGQLRANMPRIGDGFVRPVRVTLRSAGLDGEGVLIEISHLEVTVSGAAALHRELRRLMALPDADELRVSIEPLGAVRWQHVVDAFNQAVRAGCRKVMLRTRPARRGAGQTGVSA